MQIAKVIAGLGCFVVALFAGTFAWVCLQWGSLWFAVIPAILALGLASFGLYLILRRRLALPKRAKILMAGFIGAVVLCPFILDLYIRQERKALQGRAKEFLSRPIPKLLTPDSAGNVGGYYVNTNSGPQNGVLGNSPVLIKRYADNGRIRWSARIQGQFASTSDDLHIGWGPEADAIRTNEEVRLYMAERNAILGKEWQMGFWQWVEDVMEFKQTIPEIEEEDRDDRYVQQFDGTWTNGSSDTLAIDPGGRFSLKRSNHNHTNTYMGTWMAVLRIPALHLTFTNATGAEPQWSIGENADFRIIHVDDHNLIYEGGGETNRMRR
ncbi:MAG TPA: hypothetical protein VFC44_15615 [Candidatus Saccharimonadales bacterium]|nr:hypothetical protein [Candidatus Saccharimonadales bacterium]